MAGNEKYVALLAVVLVLAVWHHSVCSNAVFGNISFSSNASEGWSALAFNDSAWLNAGRVMYSLEAPPETYLRQRFNSSAESLEVEIKAQNCIDEIYLNGELVFDGKCSSCADCRGDRFTLKPLMQGENVLAIKSMPFAIPYYLKVTEAKTDLMWLVLALSLLLLLYMFRAGKLDSGFHALVFFLVVSLGFFNPIYRNPWNLGIADWDVHMVYNLIPYKIITEYGQLPLWSPYLCGGDMFLANPQSQLSPFFLAILLFGPVAGVKISVVLHAIAGMFGMYLLLRQFGFRGLSTYLPSMVYMLGGVYAMHISEGHTIWATMAFVPWAFLCYLKGGERTVYAVLGGLSCALMLLGGSPYVLAYTLLFIALHAFFETAVRRDKKLAFERAKTMAVLFCALLLFSAVKLVPLLEHSSFHQFLQQSTHGMNAGMLYRALLDRQQTRYDSGIAGQYWGWWEYGAYIGLIPLLLAIAAMFSRERLPLTLTLPVLLLVAFSGVYLNLWGLLQNLPFFESLRAPSRMILMVVFVLATLSGMSLPLVEKRSRLVSLLIVAFVLVDLALVNVSVLESALPTPYLYDGIQSAEFAQVLAKPSNYNAPDYGMYSQMLPEVMANHGVVNCYSPGNIPSQVYTVGSPLYRGEAFVAGGEGNASILRFTPNLVDVAFESGSNATVVLNQNYYPGWSSPQGEVKPRNGLLSVDVPAGEGEVTFYYMPLSFKIGFSLTLASTLALAAYCLNDVWKRRRRVD